MSTVFPPGAASSASTQDGTYPRPQLVRPGFVLLDREVGFAYDDDEAGRLEHWENNPAAFTRSIRLPFAPESPASGIGDTSFHSTVWYRIVVTCDDLVTAGLNGQGERMLLHFGTVDYTCDVWVDGVHVGEHEGGQTAFTLDITDALSDDAEHVIVVRAHDDPLDTAKPRGKQDWQEQPHLIWYERITGIWRSVWLEAVPARHIARIGWVAECTTEDVRASIELSSAAPSSVRITVQLSHEGVLLGQTAVVTDSLSTDIHIPVAALRNGQDRERLLWSAGSPTLIDAVVTVSTLDGAPIDEVGSYLGIRSVGVSGGRFVVNNRPTPVRSVLEQGYWPESHYTPPSAEAIRLEVELILQLGFTATRVHQKTEDHRFLYWADRLGLMVWGEIASALEFTAVAIERTTSEWMSTVRDYASHPSIVTWVPLNESWGVQSIADSPAQQQFSSALAALTRALDPTRPVISNDGWEHTDSDIWTIHDYEHAGDILEARYGTADSVRSLLDGRGPAGRAMRAAGAFANDASAVMLTEFGGVSYVRGNAGGEEWGYSTASDERDFIERITSIFAAVTGSPVLAGFCYTQLTDTRQETNGLCDANRVPKVPAGLIAALVRRGPIPVVE